MAVSALDGSRATLAQVAPAMVYLSSKVPLTFTLSVLESALFA